MGRGGNRERLLSAMRGESPAGAKGEGKGGYSEDRREGGKRLRTVGKSPTHAGRSAEG